MCHVNAASTAVFAAAFLRAYVWGTAAREMVNVVLTPLQLAELRRAAQAGLGHALVLQPASLRGQMPMRLNKKNSLAIDVARRAHVPAHIVLSPSEVARAVSSLQRGGFLGAILPVLKGLAGPLLKGLFNIGVGAASTAANTAISNKLNADEAERQRQRDMEYENLRRQQMLMQQGAPAPAPQMQGRGFDSGSSQSRGDVEAARIVGARSQFSRDVGRQMLVSL
jgi:hypothetical protein